ncbi:hypothetical protein ACEN9X_19385 [Mucilaginibacter sp. Mucisp86]|uniref:hypothetical protein n=1 Tax=Mucilaginibacter sp. Mucisp86 TaxID=3243060 RepID=UPI0039B5D6FC
MKSDMRMLKVEFELLSDETSQTLTGGFSTSFSTLPQLAFTGSDNNTNNCQGGNCTSSCGSSQNIQCNVVAHCGT